MVPGDGDIGVAGVELPGDVPGPWDGAEVECAGEGGVEVVAGGRAGGVTGSF